MSFDPASVTIQETTSLEILHPATNEPTGWVLTLATAAHATAQAKVAGIMDRAKRRKAATPAQEEADGLALLCAHVLGWEGLVMNGEAVPYTPEAAAKLLEGPRAFWIRRQVLDAIGDPTRPFLS